MAANAPKTHMVNLAIFKLSGVTDSGTQYIKTDIDDTVFADPTTASGSDKETVRIACQLYPNVLKQAIRDIRPKWAKAYKDLGLEVEVTTDMTNLVGRADWNYLFNLPSDYLHLLAQIDEANKKTKLEANVATVYQYAHVVKGTDEQAWYASADHTSAAANKPITGGSYATNWTLFNTDDDYGATWESGKAYKASETGKLLLANEYSNIDGDSAYIEYLGYVQAGFADIPTYYDEHFIAAFTTLFASELAPYQSEASRRASLRSEYELLAKPQAEGIQSRPDYEVPIVSWLDARSA